MSNINHTPGPWSVGYCRDLNESKVTYTIGKPNSDGDSTRLFSSIEETKANKALIAAAPELLSALEIVMRTIKEIQAGKRDGGTMGQLSLDADVIEKAIKKAKGG